MESGIRIGSAKDGKLLAFIPDPETRKRPEFTGTSAAEGVAADAQGMFTALKSARAR